MTELSGGGGGKIFKAHMQCSPQRHVYGLELNYMYENIKVKS